MSTKIAEFPIDYFMWRGTKYGALLGGLVGAGIYPIVGGLYGLPVGLGFGLIMGLVLGIMMSIYSLFPPSDLDETAFRRRLVIIGTFLIMTVYGLGLYIIWHLPPSIPPFNNYESEWVGWSVWGIIFMACFVTPIPFVISSGAYTFSHYADRWMMCLSKHKNDEVLVILHRPRGYEGFFIRQFFRRVRRFAPLIAIGIGIFYAVDYYPQRAHVPPPAVEHGLAMIPFTVIYIFLTALILALMNSWLILCLNRIYFQEYVPHLTLEQYKRRLMWCAGIATFCASPILTFGIFLPLAVGIAVLTARSYAETYYQAGDKLKNDEKLKTDVRYSESN
jgi:hypothetical protein